MKLKQFIGDRAFYRHTLAIAVPMMIQNCITHFVNLLDNIMVGSLGTEAMSGVSIANQFVFIFNIVIFGACSAAGIFTAQYSGFGNIDGVRNTFRIKLLTSLSVGIIGIAAFLFFGESLIGSFLHEGTDGDLALTLSKGKEYLLYILIGLIPYSLSQAYASTLRETGITIVPMAASVASVLSNFVLNALLIFGLLGFPALGVVGAAIATSASRFIELAILIVWTHKNPRRCPYIEGAYRSFAVPASLIKQIAIKGMPLLMNEFLWSLSVTLRNQCYSTRGLDVVASLNIAVTVINVLSVCYMSIGNSIGIIVGNLLGSGDMEQARSANKKLLAFTVFVSTGIALMEIAISPIFPMLYNTTDAVRESAAYIMIISACFTPFTAFAFASYFTLRSGGSVYITFAFDSGYAWAVVIPSTLALTYLTALPIYPLYAICTAIEAAKCIFAFILVRRGAWVKQLAAK